MPCLLFLFSETLKKKRLNLKLKGNPKGKVLFKGFAQENNPAFVNVVLLRKTYLE